MFEPIPGAINRESQVLLDATQRHPFFLHSFLEQIINPTPELRFPFNLAKGLFKQVASADTYDQLLESFVGREFDARMYPLTHWQHYLTKFDPTQIVAVGSSFYTQERILINKLIVPENQSQIAIHYSAEPIFDQVAISPQGLITQIVTLPKNQIGMVKLAPQLLNHRIETINFLAFADRATGQLVIGHVPVHTVPDDPQRQTGSVYSPRIGGTYPRKFEDEMIRREDQESRPSRLPLPEPQSRRESYEQTFPRLKSEIISLLTPLLNLDTISEEDWPKLNQGIDTTVEYILESPYDANKLRSKIINKLKGQFSLGSVQDLIADALGFAYTEMEKINKITTAEFFTTNYKNLIFNLLEGVFSQNELGSTEAQIAIHGIKNIKQSFKYPALLEKWAGGTYGLIEKYNLNLLISQALRMFDVDYPVTKDDELWSQLSTIVNVEKFWEDVLRISDQVQIDSSTKRPANMTTSTANNLFRRYDLSIHSDLDSFAKANLDSFIRFFIRYHLYQKPGIDFAQYNSVWEWKEANRSNNSTLTELPYPKDQIEINNRVAKIIGIL